MLYAVGATLLILWMLGLENNRSFGVFFYSLLAFGTLALATSALQWRGKLERQKQDQAADDSAGFGPGA